MRLMRHPRPQMLGFTLLELSVTLLILALILGGGLTYATARSLQARIDQTHATLDALEEALVAYRRANDRLPCPADPTALVTDGGSGGYGGFGREISGTPGTCTGSAGMTGGGNNGVSGAVPNKALNLPDDYAFDGWGNRITYAVDKRLTAATAFSVTYPITDTTVAGDLNVQDASLTDRTGGRAVVVLVSHGANGHGAYTYGGTQQNLSSTNKAENENCNCNGEPSNNIFTAKLTTQSSTDLLDAFDDIVRYKVRWQLFSIGVAEANAVTSF